MTASRRRFEVVPPDWGQTHLSPDAVVAFVDDELGTGARRRAAAHLEACADCAGEVAAQHQARAALRSAHMPALSSSLLQSLRTIPQHTELPGVPAGLAVAPDGALVQPLRDPANSRARFGAGLAASGLAVGALALTLSLLPAGEPETGPFGGAVLGGARLQVPAAEPASAPVARPADPSFARAVSHPMDVQVTTGTDTEAVIRQLDVLPATLRASR